MKVQSFRAALAQHPEAVSELSPDTMVRYVRGDFPKVLKWLYRHPPLLEALARDAKADQVNAERPAAE